MTAIDRAAVERRAEEWAGMAYRFGIGAVSYQAKEDARKAFTDALESFLAPSGVSEGITDALRNLAAEVDGALGIAEPELRRILSNTNVNCIQRRLAEAHAALSARPNPPAERGMDLETSAEERGFLLEAVEAHLSDERALCRDCGDHDGRCPNQQVACDPTEALIEAHPRLLRRLLNDFDRLSRSPGWRGMESAPKDGTDILVSIEGRPPVVLGWFRGDWKSFDDPFRHYGEPVGWMPLLPTPPNPGEGV